MTAPTLPQFTPEMRRRVEGLIKYDAWARDSDALRALLAAHDALAERVRELEDTLAEIDRLLPVIRKGLS